ncbi:hypothetical protein US8_00463 [Bacillus altitudinis]|nr:hypothetical protein US8_00463 [Bacillus altitudinis]
MITFISLWAASFIAIAFPMPVLAPVTNAILLDKLIHIPFHQYT